MLTCCKCIHFAKLPSRRPKEVVPLTLENLPWDPETRVKQEYTYAMRLVLNKRDPTWYRPQPVLMKVNTMWTIRRYLRDTSTQAQYTVGDMEDILGIPRTTIEPSLWMSLLLDNYRSASRLKVPKPFELTPDTVQSEVKRVYDVMRDLGNRLRLPGCARPEDDLKLEDVGDTETDFEGLNELKALYQSHLDTIAKHGSDDNSYVWMMRGGDADGLYVEEKKNHVPSELGTTDSLSKPGHVTGKRRNLNYWEKLQRRKVKQKLKEELSLKHKCENNDADGDVKAVDELPLDNSDNESSNDGSSDGSSSDCEDSDKDEDVANDDTRGAAQEATGGKVKKVKKRGLLRKLASPLRWMKKKLYADNH